MTRGRTFGLGLGIALLASAAVATGQESGAMTLDIARLAPSLEPEFPLWRTGDGDVGEWTVVDDPTAADGRAVAQMSKDRTDYRFPLAVYKPFSGKNVDV